MKSQLENVSYSSRFALGLFFPLNLVAPPLWPWAARYDLNDPCIRFISLDNKKRGLKGEGERRGCEWEGGV